MLEELCWHDPPRPTQQASILHPYSAPLPHLTLSLLMGGDWNKSVKSSSILFMKEEQVFPSFVVNTDLRKKRGSEIHRERNENEDDKERGREREER